MDLNLSPYIIIIILNRTVLFYFLLKFDTLKIGLETCNIIP